MPRINIEEKWCGDPRRARLIEKLGAWTADGCIFAAWRLAQHYWHPEKKLIPEKAWLGAGMPDVLFEVGLAERKPDGIYVNGTGSHFTWLKTKAEAGESGGRISAQRPRDSLGRLLSKQRPSKPKQVQAVQASSSSSSSCSNSVKGPEGQTTTRELKKGEVDTFIEKLNENLKEAEAPEVRRSARYAIVNFLKSTKDTDEAFQCLRDDWETLVDRRKGPLLTKYILGYLFNETKKLNAANDL